MNLKLISDFGDEPLDITEVKEQVRYYPNDQDDYIAGLIVAARIMAEMSNGRQQTLKQWDLAADRWPGAALFSPGEMPNPYYGFWPSDAYRLMAATPWGLSVIPLLAPLVSVESVTYKDSGGNIITLTENVDYVVDTWKEPGIICPAPMTQWPAASLWPSSAIHVKFTAGAVPDADGYAAANPTKAPAPEVLRSIKQGMMMLISQWFSARLPYDAIKFTSEPPFAIQALFTSNKLWK